jgi:hypothetical protein
MGIRRTLYGQVILSRADSTQAPGCGGEALQRKLGPRGLKRVGYQRGCLPPLEEEIRCDERSSEAKRLKKLEKENARLKKLVAEQALDIEMLNPDYSRTIWGLRFARGKTDECPLKGR